MRNIAVFIFLFITILSIAAFAEEIKLTSIMPPNSGTGTNPSRALRSVVGTNYSNPVSLPDASIPANALLVEGNVAVGKATIDSTSGYDRSLQISGTTTGGAIQLEGAGGHRWTIGSSPGTGSYANTLWFYDLDHAGTWAHTLWLDGKVVKFGDATGCLYTTQAQHNPTTGYEAVLTVMNGSGTANDEIWIGPNTGTSNGNVTLSSKNIYLQSTDVYGPTAAHVHWTSDASLKTDVVTIPNALDRVCALRGVNYRLKDKSSSQPLEMGVVAQEVEKVFPEVVGSDSDGKKYVAYLSLTGALIEAIKDQQKEIKDQKKEIGGLRSDIAELKSKLNRTR